MPHLDQIQASFGRHDVSHVRSQTGGSAAESSKALGASAFAMGDRVGFASSPDLHTAAHEAAHVVQQRAGVQLEGGLDRGKGDPYEQHADAVADKVVRGESAEALLAPYAGKGGGAAVQRKSDPETPHGMVNARRYLQMNAYEARTAIFEHLKQQRLPQPHPRMQWLHEQPFYEQLFRGLLGLFGHFELPADIAQLVFPGSPYELIDQMRPLTKAVEADDKADQMKGGAVGPWNWSPAIGLAFAQLVEQSLISSLYRLGPRWIAIADTLGSGSITVEPSAIARSHPMDRYVVPAMCMPNVFELLPEAASKKKAPKKDPKIGLRDITLTWVGKDKEHRDLWNWVRASSADATAEEVSAKLFDYMTSRDHDTRADYYAAFLTAAPPMFGIPPQWAKTFEETRDFRPKNVTDADADPDHQVAALGGSTLADEQALVEIGAGGAAKDKHAKAPQGGGEHDNLVADTTAQAMFLKTTLAGWKLGESADKTLAFLTRRKQDGADPAKWVPVLNAQRENLTRIATGILQLDQAAAQMKLAKTGAQARPLFEIMRFYADATATAHLNQTCNRMILRAANAQSALAVQGLQSSAHDMDTSIEAMRAGVSPDDWDRRKISNVGVHLDTEAVAMQTRLMRGEKVSGEELEDLQLRLEETSLEAKFTAIDFSLHELESAAAEAGDGIAAWFASRFSSKFRGLKDATQAIRDEIYDIRFKWKNAKDRADMPGEEDAQDHTKENLRAALEAAKKEFDQVSKKDKIREFLQEGANTVKWQQFRTACVRVAALIGISLVGGFVGGMVARGAAGMMMGTSGAVAMENLSLGGAMVARGAGLVTETAITSVGQSVVFDDKLGDAFLENMIMNVGSAGVLKAIAGKGEELAKVEKAAAGFWQKGKQLGTLAIKETAALTGHTIMGIAMGYVAHKIVTGEGQPPPATLQEWMLQGAGIAVGRYVGKAMEASHARQQHLKLKGIEPSAKLAAETETLAQLAKRVEAHPQAKDAMELLEKRHQVLTEELKSLEDLEKSPEKLKTAKIDKAELRKSKAELKHQLADVHSQGFADVPLHLSGMHELIPGVLWSGTHEQIDAAVHTAKESGIDIHATQDGGKWHLEVEGRKIEVEERFDGKVKPPKPSHEANKPHESSTKTEPGAREHPGAGTKAGGTPVASEKGDAGFRAAENNEAMSGRAQAHLDAMDAPARSRYQGIVQRTTNHAQRTMLERALAAGHSLDEIHALMLSMSGLSEADVLQQYTGHGLVQFYQQSCVPTAYQIAVAEVDPVYAMHLRFHPEEMMAAQKDALAAGGGAQTQRHDVRTNKNVPKPVDEHLKDPSMGPKLKKGPYSNVGEPGGMETTEMIDQPLHGQLEKATGATYKVITNDGLAYKKPGHGEFDASTMPHDKILAALDQQLPVIVGTKAFGGHAQTIIGRSFGPNGEIEYIVTDPMSGGTAKYKATDFEKFGIQSITIPEVGQGVVEPTRSGSKTDHATTTGAGPHETEREPDGFDRSRAQAEALQGAKTNNLDKTRAATLAAELKRQVPDLELMNALEAGDGKSVVSIVYGGIKKMNDKVLGKQLNDEFIEARKKVVREVFESHKMIVADQDYKRSTIVSKEPAEQLGGTLKTAFAEIDRRMQAELKLYLAKAETQWQRDLKAADETIAHAHDEETRKKGEARASEAKSHLAEIAEMQHAPPAHFDMVGGAADVKKGAKYKDVVAAEMDATKAALMARDAGSAPDPRTNIYSPQEFVKFCHDTVALRGRLVGKTLELHGEHIPVVTGEPPMLDRDLLYAVRKGKIKVAKGSAEEATLRDVEQYLRRINVLDYIAPFTSGEVGKQAKLVEQARRMLAELQADKINAKDIDTAALEQLLTSGPPKENTAAEAKFFGKAGRDEGHERVVLNADIRDLGVDLMAGFEQKIGEVHSERDIGRVSSTANDNVVEQKRAKLRAFERAYKKLLPEAKARATAQHRPDLVAQLDAEPTPQVLLGGDEITVSLPAAFKELGLVPKVVEELAKTANARVGVAEGRGEAGHRKAMATAESAHGMLKKYEELGKLLRNSERTMSQGHKDHAEALRAEIDHLYTFTDEQGTTDIRSTDGKPVNNIRLRAEQLIPHKIEVVKKIFE